MKIGYIKDYYPEQRCIIDKVGGGENMFFVTRGWRRRGLSTNLEG